MSFSHKINNIEGDDYSKHTFNTAKNMIDDNKRG